MLQSVLDQYGIEDRSLVVETFGSGLINNTWKISEKGKAYIVQKINTHVFKHPEYIADNIDLISGFLKANQPDYLFVSPLQATDGKSLVHKNEEGFFRAFPFVADSCSRDIAETPEQAFEAAVQFGRFTSMLKNIEVGKLKITIPAFHDLALRYRQFLQSLETGSVKRVAASKSLIEQILDAASIVSEYETIKANPAFKLRVTHHDTKISNVLFNRSDKALCVIDLDTVMPGYFISDLGDMFRTYLSPCNEEERDTDKVIVRTDYFEAITAGYLSEMGNELSQDEKAHIIYAGEFMIYMQAIRFLTDFLNGDMYYQSRYEEHNLVRARNQIALLQSYQHQKQYFQTIIEKYI